MEIWSRKTIIPGQQLYLSQIAPQPIKEEYLLSGNLEKTNIPYALAKISGIIMCESYFRQYGCNFISLIPTNLYGPGDHYDLDNSHVLPAILRKMYLGKCLETKDLQAINHDLQKNPISGLQMPASRMEIIEGPSKYGISLIQNPPHPGLSGGIVKLWGSGKVYREFLHVEDLADACLYVMEHLEAMTLFKEFGISHINVGTSQDLCLSDLARLIKQITGFNGNLEWELEKPDGTPRKLLDISRILALGWKPDLPLHKGISEVYQEYILPRDMA